MILGEACVLGQEPDAADSDCTGQAIVAAIHLDLFLAFFRFSDRRHGKRSD